MITYTCTAFLFRHYSQFSAAMVVKGTVASQNDNHYYSRLLRFSSIIFDGVILSSAAYRFSMGQRMNSWIDRNVIRRAVVSSLVGLACRYLYRKAKLLRTPEGKVRHRTTRGNLRYVFWDGVDVPVNNILLLAIRLTRSGIGSVVEREQLRRRLHQEIDAEGLSFEEHCTGRDFQDPQRFAAEALRYYSKPGRRELVVDHAVDFVSSPDFSEQIEVEIRRHYEAMRRTESIRRGTIASPVQSWWWAVEAKLRYAIGLRQPLPSH